MEPNCDLVVVLSVVEEEENPAEKLYYRSASVEATARAFLLGELGLDNVSLLVDGTLFRDVPLFINFTVCHACMWSLGEAWMCV